MSQSITIRTAALAGVPAGLTVIYAAENEAPSGAAATVWAATGLAWAETAEAGAFKGKQGQALDVLASGGKRLLVIPAHKAYGDRSPTPKIPPNSALVFEVHLVKIIQQPPA